MTDPNDLGRRNIMDGDPFMASSPSWRFKSPEVEPYMPSQSPGDERLAAHGLLSTHLLHARLSSRAQGARGSKCVA